MYTARAISIMFLSALSLGCDLEVVIPELPAAAESEDSDSIDDPCDVDPSIHVVGCPGERCAHGACRTDEGWSLDLCEGEELDEDGNVILSGECPE